VNDDFNMNAFITRRITYTDWRKSWNQKVF
jgi:hypothetical protein